MDMEDMVAMEAMVVMDTTERGKQMLYLKLMPSQDTSPEDMVDMVMEAMEAMVVMDTMERERLKPSQDMADTDAATTVRGRLKPNQDTSPEVMDTGAMAMEAMAAMDTMERGRPKPSQDI